MGTGSVSALAARFHFGTDSVAIKVITLFFFFLNLGLFVLITGATVARYCMFPEVRFHGVFVPEHVLSSMFNRFGGRRCAILLRASLSEPLLWVLRR